MNHIKLPSLHQSLFKRIFYISLFCVLAFSGCTIKLSPSFDQDIVDNLSSSSTEVFQLFANVSGGTTSSTFNTREEKYNDVIGRLEALILSINARPMPKSKVVDKIIGKANSVLTVRGSPAITAGDTAASASALSQVVANIAKMKETDKASGLNDTQVKLFLGNVRLFLDQATTYEKFLNQ